MIKQNISPSLAKRIEKIRTGHYPEKAKENMIASILLRSDPRFEVGGCILPVKKFGYYCVFDGVRYEGKSLPEIYRAIPCFHEGI